MTQIDEQDTTSIDEQREIEKLIALPHIQEFYNWCSEEDVPEDIMYKIAGWLGSEIYFIPANVAVIIQKHISDQVREAVDKTLTDLEDFKQEVLESRGIPNPTYVGKKELQEWIDNRRATLNGVKNK